MQERMQHLRACANPNTNKYKITTITLSSELFNKGQVHLVNKSQLGSHLGLDYNFFSGLSL